MKVKIGQYLSWLGPYQIADLLKYVRVSEDRCFKIGGWLSETFLNNICQWIYDKRKRTVEVKIDKWDTWNMDSTLAIIILPMLKQLKETKHGSQLVDDCDVPEQIKSTSAPHKENEWDVDDLVHDRWDWVMSELIWTFEQLQPDNDWESQYHENDFDKEGYMEHNNRIAQGLMLFGKYFRGLWD